MRRFIAIPLLALAAALQSSIIPQIRFSSGQPDLVVLIVLAWAFHADLEEALFWAFTGGILQDLLSIAPLGASVIGLLPTIFVINLIAGQLYNINIILIFGIFLFGTIIQHVGFLMVLAVTGIGIDLIGNIRYVMIPSLLYNLALALPVYWVVRQIQKSVTREAFASQSERP